jgi:hypothetical protein
LAQGIWNIEVAIAYLDFSLDSTMVAQICKVRLTFDRIVTIFVTDSDSRCSSPTALSKQR